MLPQHLIVDFWTEVKDRLQKEHGLRGEQADQFITLYRQRMQAHGGEEMAYHESPEDMARGLSHGGILDPHDPTHEEIRQGLVSNYPELAELIEDEDSAT